MEFLRGSLLTLLWDDLQFLGEEIGVLCRQDQRLGCRAGDSGHLCQVHQEEETGQYMVSTRSKPRRKLTGDNLVHKKSQKVRNTYNLHYTYTSTYNIHYTYTNTINHTFTCTLTITTYTILTLTLSTANDLTSLTLNTHIVYTHLQDLHIHTLQQH